MVTLVIEEDSTYCHYVVQVLCNETVSLHLSHPSVRSSGLPLCTAPGEQCREQGLARDTSVALGLSGDLPVAKPSPYGLRHHRPLCPCLVL